jgi:hypothetical protein
MRVGGMKSHDSISSEGRIKWPEGKRFAFTVFDDTDHASLKNGPTIYRFLSEIGLRTTKSVWPIRGSRQPRIGGATCEDSDYLNWVLRLQEQQFEIALHNVTYHSSQRSEIVRGLERFKELFGAYPNIQVNHNDCEDGLYWGSYRLSGSEALLYDILTQFRNHRKFYGAVESSELFWGDLCKERIKYVRNFVYSDVNTLKACPFMPYHDTDRPYVNYWFASSEGSNCPHFCKTISEQNQDRLEEEGGACIMYTHFGLPSFSQDGILDGEFQRLMLRLSRKEGWFVPVTTLLDFIQRSKGEHIITGSERKRLERKWLFDKVFNAIGPSR